MENEKVQIGSYDSYKGREYFKENILAIVKLQYNIIFKHPVAFRLIRIIDKCNIYFVFVHLHSMFRL
jgi:hypothetical protein